jgi:hypothetical protein
MAGQWLTALHLLKRWPQGRLAIQYFKSYAAPPATLTLVAHFRELTSKTWPKQTHIPVICGQNRIDLAGS